MAETKQHLQEIDLRLQYLSRRGSHIADEDSTEWEQLKNEKVKCENELATFARVLDLLDKVEVDHLNSVLEDRHTYQIVHDAFQMPPEDCMTALDVQKFMEKIPHAMSDLKMRLTSVESKLKSLSPLDLKMQEKLRDDKRIDEHCIDTFMRLTEKAGEKRANVIKDVSAARRSHQIVISTFGDLIRCENVTAGVGAKQWLGQMSDVSFQLLCQNQSLDRSVNSRTGGHEGRFQSEKWISWGIPALLIAFIIWVADRGREQLV
jgi:hypothetical protein